MEQNSNKKDVKERDSKESPHTNEIVQIKEVDCKVKKAEDCAMQHIKAFHEQALRGKAADYGEPCMNCPYTNECDYDWNSIMLPLMERSQIKISMVH